MFLLTFNLQYYTSTVRVKNESEIEADAYEIIHISDSEIDLVGEEVIFHLITGAIFCSILNSAIQNSLCL